jgi:PhzF family phenazine biosynthesis protein
VRIFVIDAFTDRAFSGNPAGVVLLEHDADAGWMQRVAGEMHHSETAFVQPRTDGSFALRWFTPTVEVDLCGHATLATAHALASDGAPGTFCFDTRSGVLNATVADDGTIGMNFPAKPVRPVAEPAGLADALGTAPRGVYGNGMDLLVELADAAAISALSPDLSALAALECRGVCVTAAAGAGADRDFVSRFFAPAVGVDEDPVTGSAHCALGPFWAARLGRRDLSGVQCSPRGGRVGVRVEGDRVTLTGRAVTVLDGELRAHPGTQ